MCHIIISKSKFTFHYVSISTGVMSLCRVVTALFTFHYVSISTRRHRRKVPSFHQFTFHYVSISTLYEFTKHPIAKLFTFHYVSISTDYRSRSDLQNYDIYIPLCIYFNKFRPFQTPNNQYYLHSTMYLFQRSIREQ